MPGAVDPIKIKGLRDIQAALKEADGESQKQLRVVLNEAAELVAADARRGYPTRTGTAKGTIRAMSSQRESRVRQGGGKAPYAPWLDYGGRVGPGRSISRPFRKEGRYLYPAYHRNKPEVLAALETGIVAVAERAGLTVT